VGDDSGVVRVQSDCDLCLSEKRVDIVQVL